MFCCACGQKFQDEYQTKFCPNCGTASTTGIYINCFIIVKGRHPYSNCHAKRHFDVLSGWVGFQESEFDVLRGSLNYFKSENIEHMCRDDFGCICRS